MVASSSASPAPPLLAQRYRLERRLAQGGMAEVWLATDTLLTRQVAVKVLKPALAADPVVAERFRREAVAVAGLTHPNIVAIYDTVDEGGRQAVVMQFVPGKSLRQLLDEDATLTPEMTIRIGIAVSGALDAAHQAGLVHRDVKPGNILVTPEGRVLLTDFGIAKALSGEGDLTSDNVMMGTAKYLSPEQVRGRRLDGRADLYSLGLVLYECLVGRVPFLGDNDAATALARLQRDPTPLHVLRPTLPGGLAALIHRLLQRNPDERPASGSLVQSQLERIRAGGFDDHTSPTPAPGSPKVRTATPARGTPVTPAPGRRPATGRPAGVPPSGPTPRPGRPPERREPTPSAGIRLAGRPNRQFEQRRTPSLVVVGGLVLLAFIVVGALFSALGGDQDDGAGAGSTPPEQSVPVAVTAATTVAGGPADVVRVFSYDPNGDDGIENEEQIPNLRDGADSTSWSTVCYSNQWMGGKVGVGVVLELSGPSRGNLELTFGSTPWAVKVFTADELPEGLNGWGGSVDDQYSTDALSARFDLGPTPRRYVLVLFTELGNDSSCTGDNPYRGRISELVFSPTG